MAFREYVSDKEKKKEETKNYSHLMLTSAWAPNPLEVRDGNNNVLNWDNHPDYGKTHMKMIDNPAMTVSGPAYAIKNQNQSHETFKKTSGMSMDGLFIPYATNFVIQSDGGHETGANRPNDGIAMPTFERPYATAKGEDSAGNRIVEHTVEWEGAGNETLLGANAPAPPFITSVSLNPFASGHNVNVLNKNLEINDPVQVAQGGGYSKDAPRLTSAPEKSVETARPVGLRGPLVMGGWGYDIYGKPVPNLRDDADYKYNDENSANYGRTRYYPPALQAKTESGARRDHKHFLPHHMRRSDRWKVGPVDLRWDPNRKVWVGGKHNGIYLSKAAKCILPKAGIDGNNSFNFGVGGNVNAPGRLYRNPCPTHDCTYTSYFPTSIYYPDIEIYDPEDHNWCGRCRTLGHLTACADFKDGCSPFYDAIILRPVDEIVGKPNQLTECTDKFRKVQGGAPGARRAGNPCHGWGSSYFGEDEFINEKIAIDKEWSQQAKNLMYEKIFIENPLGQGLMVGDAFFSYDTGRRITYEYERMKDPGCGQTAGTKIKVKETIPVHVILQGEFYGMEIVTHAGCDRGEMAACSKKFFAQGFATAEDCGPDDDYPETAGI